MAVDSNKSLRFLSSSTNELTKIFARLASGKRLATDDPAGLAVGESFRNTAAVLGVARNNTANSGSALDIADAALGQISNIAVRLSELATQSANGTQSPEQRAANQLEADQLTQEIQRISATTGFNGNKLLEGGELVTQNGAGGGSGDQTVVVLPDIRTQATALSSISISTQGAAQTAIDSFKGFADEVARKRGEIGAAQSRLNSVSERLPGEIENALAAESRIRDVNIAEEVSRRTSALIIQQSSSALIAQAGKLNRDSVLRLLS